MCLSKYVIKAGSGKCAGAVIIQKTEKVLPSAPPDERHKIWMEPIMKKRQNASLTVETAMSLTLFFFAVVLLSLPIEILSIHRKVQTVLDTAARELSWQVYVPYRLSQGDDSLDAAAVSSDAEGETGMVTAAVLPFYLREKVKQAAGEKLEEVSCAGSCISENGEIIDLRASYTIRISFSSVFSPGKVRMASRSMRRGWIGAEGGYFSKQDGKKENDRVVYVGAESTRYHISPNCHYISNEITAVAADQISRQRNTEGKRYKACRVCGTSAQSADLLYILPGGEHYHSRQDCSSLVYYVRAVPLSSVEHLGACSYCGGGK